MKKILSLLICVATINISCQKKTATSQSQNSIIDTLIEKPTFAYFDDDNIKDKLEILARPNAEKLSYEFSISMSDKVIRIPILNNSVLYNNKYSDYYLSDPIVKNKIVNLRIEYSNQTTIPNISGEKKDLVENIKFRFDSKNNNIQIIGYDVSYSKEGKGKFEKSFNFLTGNYFSKNNYKSKNKESSGSARELKNIYINNWNSSFINKILLYGSDVE